MSPPIIQETKTVAVLVRMPPTLAEIVRRFGRNCSIKDPEAIRQIIEMWGSEKERKTA